jgi:hypothetical protein
VHQLAEQTERLVEPMRAPLGTAPDDQHDAEVALEEDRSPERGPAARAGPGGGGGRRGGPPRRGGGGRRGPRPPGGPPPPPPFRCFGCRGA